MFEFLQKIFKPDPSILPISEVLKLNIKHYEVKDKLDEEFKLDFIRNNIDRLKAVYALEEDAKYITINYGCLPKYRVLLDSEDCKLELYQCIDDKADMTKVGYFTMFCNNLEIFKKAQDIKKIHHSKDWCDYIFEKVQWNLFTKDLKLVFNFPDNANSVQKDQLIISLEFIKEDEDE